MKIHNAGKSNIISIYVYWEKPNYPNFTDTKRISQVFRRFKTCDMLEVSVPIGWSDLLYINMFQLIIMGDFYLCQRLQLLNYIWQITKRLRKRHHRKTIEIIKDSIITADIFKSRFINCMGKLREYNVKISFFISGVLKWTRQKELS